ncbi:MAG: DUF4337 domain-containing protein [Armatimonadetes bacterium]|nr:DUF4337 domain-containing protein [Armatimonadota bacterium]
MDPTEVIQEVSEEEGAGSSADAQEAQREQAAREERFRNFAALWIAILALLLAVTSLGGGNVAEDMIATNIHASDTWNFYQAKNQRQTLYEIARDQLQIQQSLAPNMAPAAKQAIAEKLAEYEATIARYEDEPDPEAPDDPLKGDGKKQLRARAEDWEKQREKSQDQDPNFDYAEALFQIAVILASVAILAKSRAILTGSLAVGVLGSVLLMNGFGLYFKLPF